MKHFALLLIPLFLAAGCATSPDPSTAIPDLDGTWQSFEKGGSESDLTPAAEAVVTFREDGSFKFHVKRADGSEKDYAGTHILTPSVLMVNFKEGAEGLEQLPYEFDDGVLKVFDSAADAWLKFRLQTK